jgi:hypothetical protein
MLIATAARGSTSVALQTPARSTQASAGKSTAPVHAFHVCARILATASTRYAVRARRDEVP